jgi:hypothetical protein
MTQQSPLQVQLEVLRISGLSELQQSGDLKESKIPSKHDTAYTGVSDSRRVEARGQVKLSSMSGLGSSFDRVFRTT